MDFRSIRGFQHGLTKIIRNRDRKRITVHELDKNGIVECDIDEEERGRKRERERDTSRQREPDAP